MLKQNIICHCCAEGSDPTSVLKLVIEKKYTAISVAFTNARFLEGEEGSFTIFLDFTDPIDPEIIRYVTLTFYILYCKTLV